MARTTILVVLLTTKFWTAFCRPVLNLSVSGSISKGEYKMKYGFSKY